PKQLSHHVHVPWQELQFVRPVLKCEHLALGASRWYDHARCHLVRGGLEISLKAFSFLELGDEPVHAPPQRNAERLKKNFGSARIRQLCHKINFHRKKYVSV
ncbi:unnamed protein product, partial [Ixodes pacificus]